MAELNEVLTDKFINADIEDLKTSDRNYRFNNTKLGDEFTYYEEFTEWYDRFCFEWYNTCKSIAKLLKV